MRLILASAVVASHTVNVAYGQEAADALFHSPLRCILGMVVPMFFAASGFLVAGSLERNRSLISFFGLRAIRIVPALAFDTLISALILGVIFTTLPIGQYVAQPEFRTYFLNIVGYIHYTLPGVFAANPDPFIVNAQLWTIPAEIQSYLFIGLFSLVGVLGRRSSVIGTVVAIQLFLIARGLHFWADSNPTVVGRSILVGCALVGVCAFRLREIIPLHRYAAILAMAVCFALLLTPHGDWLLPIPLAYLTIFLGTLSPKRDRVLLSGDYSYGLYLFGYPIEQAVASFPSSHAWWINLSISYPLAFGIAVFSWWCVEKPAMGLKKFVYAFEEHSSRISLFKWRRGAIRNAAVDTLREAAAKQPVK